MLFIKNTSDAVRVIKAWGYKDIRMLPGMNQVPIEMEDLDRMKTAKAVKGLFDSKILKVVDETKLSPKDLKEAKEARAKNDTLNKAKKIHGQGTPAQAEAQQRLIDQEKTIAELKKELEKLKKQKVKAS